MEPSNLQDLAHRSQNPPTPRTTLSETWPYPAENDLHKSFRADDNVHNYFRADSDSHNYLSADNDLHHSFPAHNDFQYSSPAHNDLHDSSSANDDLHNFLPADHNLHTSSPVDNNSHLSFPPMKSSLDNEKSPTSRDVEVDTHQSLKIVLQTTSSAADTNIHSFLAPTIFLVGDEVTCDKEDMIWYTEEEESDLIPVSVPEEANSIRVDRKKLAVHQLLVLLHLHTEHFGDRCSGSGIQDWMLWMLDRNFGQAYDDAFAHVRKEREPNPNNQHGAFLNLWIRRTFERLLQDAANKTLVEIIEVKTREGCTVNLESYERMLSTCGVQGVI